MEKIKQLPPKWADQFLEWYCHPELLEEIQGDLYETYQKHIHQNGQTVARVYFILNVILFLRLSTIRNLTPQISTIMWQNYIKIAWRNLLKHRGFSILNISGLTIGIATALLIFLWIKDELAFDRFHEEGDRIYRVMRNLQVEGDKIMTIEAVPYLLEQELETSYPEVEEVDYITWPGESVITYEDESFRQTGRYVGESFFETFSYPFLFGDPRTVLDDVSNIVISESLARKVTGNNISAAMGKILRINIERNEFRDFTIAGIFKDMPDNSTYQFDFVLPFKVYLDDNPWLDSWTNNGLRMFITLKEGTDANIFEEKIKHVIHEHAPEEPVELFLQPYEDMHLYSEFKEGKIAGGRIEYVRIFFFVALFLLLIASINFMNLSTARSTIRAREVGVRKTVGAHKRNLISQFIWESVFITVLSLGFALIVVTLILPYFNELTGKQIIINWMDPQLILGLVGLTVLLGVFSGSYPAFFLSSFNILRILKGTFTPRSGSISLRKGLVIIQFVLANILIVGTLTLNQQIQFVKNKHLGYNRDHVIYMSMEGNVGEKYEVFKDQLMQHSGIVDITATTNVPTSIFRSTGGMSWEGKNPEEMIEINIIHTHHDYLKTMKLELLEGRGHSLEYAADTSRVVINERAAEIMGMEKPIGKFINIWGDDYQVIGLVKDFHFRSLHEPIEPIVIGLDYQFPSVMLIRLDGEQTEEALNFIASTYEDINPGFPFSYNFLDESYARTFESEMVVGKLSQFFSMIGIFISCLGLFGLSTFSVERKSREIGIRKILGASISQVILLITKDFMRLALIAFMIAIPIVWYLMNQWLMNFAYHIQIGMGIFLAGGILSLLIAIFTLSFQSIKAARSNPVDALRTE